MRLSSLEGKLALLLVAAAVAAAFLSAALAIWTGSLWLAAIVAVLACLLPLLWAAHAAMQPVRRLLRALSGSVASYRDGAWTTLPHLMRGLPYDTHVVQEALDNYAKALIASKEPHDPDRMMRLVDAALESRVTA